MQKLSKVIGGCGRRTDGHTDAFGKVHNCSLMTTVGNEAEKGTDIQPSYFVYCPECFLSFLLSFQTENQREHDYVEECMQLSPGRRLGRTVWPKGQTQTHHITAVSSTGVPFSLVSTNLVQ